MGRTGRETSGPRPKWLSVGSQSRDRSPRSAVQILGHWNSFTALLSRCHRRRRRGKKRSESRWRELAARRTCRKFFLLLLPLYLPPLSLICDTVPFVNAPILLRILVARTNANNTKAILFHRHAARSKLAPHQISVPFPRRLFCLHQLYSWRIARIPKHK